VTSDAGDDRLNPWWAQSRNRRVGRSRWRGRQGVVGCYGEIDQSAGPGGLWPIRSQRREGGCAGLLR
jgi:hypothetical protein